MRGDAVSNILKGKSWRFNCYSSGDFFQREREEKGEEETEKGSTVIERN